MACTPIAARNQILLLLCSALCVALSANACGGEDGSPAGETTTQGGSGGETPESSNSGGSTGGGMSASGTIGGSGGTSSSAGAAGDSPGMGGTAAEPNSGGMAGSAGAAGAGLVAFDVDYELASDVDPEAPGTIGIVQWSVDLDRIEKAHLEFGLDTNYGMVAPVDDVANARHRTLLLGMKPARSYHFRVVVTDSSGTYSSEDHVIQTGPPTDLVGIAEFDVLDEAARERGFIIMSYLSARAGTPFILDSDGEVVWWYPRERPTMRASMSATGKNMWMIEPNNNEGAPLERVTMDTLESETYPDTLGSHDITPVEGELMAYIDYGEEDCDSIFEIDPTGTVQEVFESEDYVDPDCHGNAVRYSQREDVYTYSDANRDIFVINRQGGVEWRLSEIVPEGSTAWGNRSHGHQLLDDSLLLFANHGGPDTSAIFEFALTGEEIMYYDTGLLTDVVGDALRLPGGNTLITLATPSIIQEIDEDGNVVLEIKGSGAPIGYALWRESLYGPPLDISQ